MILSRLMGRLIVLSGGICLIVVACAVMLGGTISSWQITYRVFTSPRTGWAIRTLHVGRNLSVEWIRAPSSSGGISLAPNRELVMFEVTRADNSRVWVVQDGTYQDLHNVHIANPTISQPIWSRDSSHIAYYQDGRMLIAPIGQPAIPVNLVLNSPALIGSTVNWSADSQTLRFVTSDEAGDNDVMLIVNQDTSVNREIPLSRQIITSQWSSDAQSFAFIDNEDALYIFNPDTQDSPQFITQLSVNGRRLIWSPDNTQLAVIHQDFEAFTAEIHIVTLADNQARHLLTTPTIAPNVVWSPDSTQLALINAYTPNPLDNGVAELSVMSLTNDRLLTDEAIAIDRRASEVYWSPDSTQLMYYDETTQQVMIVNTDGSDVHPLDNNPTTTYWIMP